MWCQIHQIMRVIKRNFTTGSSATLLQVLSKENENFCIAKIWSERIKPYWLQCNTSKYLNISTKCTWLACLLGFASSFLIIRQYCTFTSATENQLLLQKRVEENCLFVFLLRTWKLNPSWNIWQGYLCIDIHMLTWWSVSPT